MSPTAVWTAARRRITLGRSLGSGGEGEVFLVRGGGQVAKIYWPGRRSTEQRRKLEVMVAHPPNDPMRSRGYRSLAWPSDLLFEGGAFAGFLMPYLDTRKCRPLHEVYSPTTYPAGIDWRMLVLTARNLAAALEALHRERYVAGDLNESNVLAATNAIVTFVDCDSMQVPDPGRGRVYRSSVGKAEYTPPELQGRDFSRIDRTPASDRFALAVLICQLLVRGRHPFAGRPPNRIEDNIATGDTIFATGFATAPGAMPPPELLPPELWDLFERAFVQGHRSPRRRPSARDWQEELDRLLHRIVSCPQERSHKYSAQSGSCPWCDFERAHGIPAYPTARRHRRPARSPAGGRHRRLRARGAVPGAPGPVVPPPSPVGGTGSGFPSPGVRLLRNFGSGLYDQIRRAATGCVLGLLLLAGLLMSLPLLFHNAAPPPSGQPSGAVSQPAPAPPPQGGAMSGGPPPYETVVQETLRARSEPESWERLAASLRKEGRRGLAGASTAFAALLSSEVSSAMTWKWGPQALDLLRAVGSDEDEWLGDEGDRAALEAREESAQVLYSLAHVLDRGDREWLRKIEPRRGLRVRRGIDWRADYGDQDGGRGRTGLVTAVPPETPPGWVAVAWQNGEGNWYRWGEGSRYELGLAVPWNGAET